MIRDLALSVRRWLIGSPSRLTTPSTPSNASAGGPPLPRPPVWPPLGGRPLPRGLPVVPAQGGVGRAGLGRVACQPDDLVAPGEQRVAERRADEAAGPGDEGSHGSTVEKVPVSSEILAIPVRFASSM